MMIKRKWRAKKFFKIVAREAGRIKELVAMYVIESYNYRLLDFRFVVDIPEGKSHFDISMEISKLMGKLYEVTSNKKYPFDLDAMCADDRGREGEMYWDGLGYEKIFARPL